MRRCDLRAHPIPDAQLAAPAIEHGLVVCPTDIDLARCGELRWVAPLAP